MATPGTVVTTRAAGHDVVVRRWGAAGPLVVLVHGIGVSWRYFRPLVEVLAPDHRVLAPDLPGFGDSPRPPAALGIEEHAAVVAALVDQSRDGEDDVVLLGHSMGAQVVCAVAAVRPGLARRVLLAGPVAEPGARSALRQGARLLRDTRFETWRANAVVLSDYLRCGLPWYLSTLPHMLAWRLEDHLADVVDPVVLVRGEHDRIAPPDYLHRLAALPRTVDVVEVPGEGHVVMYRSPEAVAPWCAPLPRPVGEGRVPDG